MIVEAGAVSCYVDYAPSFGRGPFGHYICTSVNDAVLHGLPHDYRLADGDLLTLDLAVSLDGVVEMGAGLTLSELEAALGDSVPLLAQVWPQFASRLIRNGATVGGNLATASPIGDLSPALLALEASVVLASAAAIAAATSSWAFCRDASACCSCSSDVAEPMSTRVRGPSTSSGMPLRLFMVEPSPSSALPISLGTIHTLLASPSAIFGSIWRYW